MKIVGGLIGSLALTISVELASAQTIKIGMMLPFSGVSADLGEAQVKGFDLYVKLHAKDLEPYKLDIIKREEGPPSGAIAKTVATELITIDKVKLITGVVGSPSAIAMAPVITQAKVPLITSNAGTAWITNLSPYIVRFSFSMWHPAYPMGTFAAKSLGCKTAAMGYTNFPPGKLPADPQFANTYYNLSQGEGKSGGDVAGPWNSGPEWERVDDRKNQMAVDGGDGQATVPLSAADKKTLAALVKRTKSATDHDVVTGADLGAGAGAGKTTPRA